MAGWIFTYGLSFLRSIPSLGAVVENGGGIWILGVMLGLEAALYRGDHKLTCFWLAALAVYPDYGPVAFGLSELRIEGSRYCLLRAYHF